MEEEKPPEPQGPPEPEPGSEDWEYVDQLVDVVCVICFFNAIKYRCFVALSYDGNLENTIIQTNKQANKQTNKNK